MAKKSVQPKDTTVDGGFYFPDTDHRGIAYQGSMKVTDFDEASKYLDPIVENLISFSTFPMSRIDAGGVYRFGAGNVAAPGISWSADTDTGTYLIGDANPGEAVAGVLKYDWNATRMKFATSYYLQLGPTYPIYPNTNEELISCVDSFGGPLRIAIKNTSVNGAAHSTFGAYSNEGNDCAMGIANSSYSAGLLAAGEGFVVMNSGAGGGPGGRGLYIVNALASYLRLGTNSLERARILSDGKIGFNTTTPRRLADFLDTTAPQLRLTYTDNSVYTDFQTDSSGNFFIVPSGQFIKFYASVFFKGPLPWIDVRAYGAKGDNVNDDSTAIQNAISAIPAGGGILYIPAGTYKCVTGLTTGTATNFRIVGSGKGSTTINYTGAGIGLQIGNTAGSIANAHIEISEFTVNSAGTKAISVQQVQDCNLTSVECICAAGVGLELLGSNSCIMTDVHARGCIVGFDLVVSGFFNANLNQFLGGQVTGNGTAIRALGLSSLNYIAGLNVSTSTSSPAVKIEQAYCWTIENCDFEGNAGGAGTYSIQVGNTGLVASGTIIRGNQFNESNGVVYGIRMLNTDRCLIEGNQVIGGITGALIRLESGASKTTLIGNASQGGTVTTVSDASGSTDTVRYDAVEMSLGTALPIIWGTGAAIGLSLYRDADNILAQRNSTVAQELRLYNTYTSSTNHEKLIVSWKLSANNCYITTQKGSGGGTARSLFIRTEDAATTLTLGCSGNDLFQIDNTNALFPLNTNTSDLGKTTKTYATGYFGTGLVSPLLTINAGTIVTDTTTGLKIATGTTQKLGFFNAAPVVQQNGTGETVGFTAGAGTNVTDQSTFTGNVGATAYRISDVVKALKNLGLLAS